MLLRSCYGMSGTDIGGFRRVLTMGSSEYGALGLGGRVRKVAVPTVVTSKVLEKRRFVHLGVGEEHCAAVTSKGNVYTWGQVRTALLLSCCTAVLLWCGTAVLLYCLAAPGTVLSAQTGTEVRFWRAQGVLRGGGKGAAE